MSKHRTILGLCYAGLASILVLLSVTLAVVVVASDADEQQTAAVQGPPVIMEILDPSLAPFARMWQLEIGRRFPHAVGVFVHGGGPMEAEWLAHTQPYAVYETDLAKRYQALYPDRTVVLISCNPRHRPLGVKGVYYALNNVWLIPDRDYVPGMYGFSEAMVGPILILPRPVVVPAVNRAVRFPDAVGNIFEFVKD